MKDSLYVQTAKPEVAANATIINSLKGYELPSIAQFRDKPNCINVLTGNALDIREVPFQLSPIADEDGKKGRLFRMISLFKKLFSHKRLPEQPISAAQAIPIPPKIPNPKSEVYGNASLQLINILNKNSNSPEEAEYLKEIARVLADSFHVPFNEVLVSKDLNTIVKEIQRLRGKIGIAELAVMILIALIVEQKMYSQIGIKSESDFFRRESEVMGISSSRARDYCKRGTAFLKYRKDFREGINGTPGVSLDNFVKLHMSKLTLYERAVEKFGREGALIRLKELNFRNFQKDLAVKKTMSSHPQKHAADTVHSSASIHDTQKAEILKLNLSLNEKRALYIIAKGGLCYCTKGLAEEQIIEVEKRLHQRRVEGIENNLKMAPIRFHRNGYNPDDPLAVSEDLFGLTNVSDMILRIRSGLLLAIPARRTIALLVEKIHSEKLWKNPFLSTKYSSIRDFAMQEFGMGEEYRDYIAVGKVLKGYSYFLDGLSDMDTEAVFLKLRYLPKALVTHKGDEPLVLARLRSLTVREFKTFSEKPDFEIAFSKRLTDKQLKKFHEVLDCTRSPYSSLSHNNNYIEIYDKSEGDWVEDIVRDVLSESIEKDNLDFPALIPQVTKEEKLIS